MAHNFPDGSNSSPIPISSQAPRSQLVWPASQGGHSRLEDPWRRSNGDNPSTLSAAEPGGRWAHSSWLADTFSMRHGPLFASPKPQDPVMTGHRAHGAKPLVGTHQQAIMNRGIQQARIGSEVSSNATTTVSGIQAGQHSNLKWSQILGGKSVKHTWGMQRSAPVKPVVKPVAKPDEAPGICKACAGKHVRHTCGRERNCQIKGKDIKHAWGMKHNAPVKSVVRPVVNPDQASGTCKACAGKHVRHTCGKERNFGIGVVNDQKAKKCGVCKLGEEFCGGTCSISLASLSPSDNAGQGILFKHWVEMVAEGRLQVLDRESGQVRKPSKQQQAARRPRQGLVQLEFCPHGLRSTQCWRCNPKEFCEPHRKKKSMCPECNPAAFCPHGFRKKSCRMCNASSYCVHNRVKYTCTECKGNSICEHNKLLQSCRDCNPSYFCRHSVRKYGCVHCSQGMLCQHGIRRSNCFSCAEHRPRTCPNCPAGTTGNNKSKCEECKVAATFRKLELKLCGHGRNLSECPGCWWQVLCVDHSRRQKDCELCIKNEVDRQQAETDARETSQALNVEPNTKTLCRHEQPLDSCEVCRPCEHGVKPHWKCLSCNTSAVCEHGLLNFCCETCKHKQCAHGRSMLHCITCFPFAACKHMIVKSECLQCNPTKRCTHDRLKSRCHECHRWVCIHALPRKQCQDRKCNPLCSHGIPKLCCQECRLTCIHGRRETKCPECRPDVACEHFRLRSQCSKCNAERSAKQKICEHGRLRRQCKDCSPENFCEHGVHKRYRTCRICYEISKCEHGLKSSLCRQCNPELLCEHGFFHKTCLTCHPSKAGQDSAWLTPNHRTAFVSFTIPSTLCEPAKPVVTTLCHLLSGKACVHGIRKASCRHCSAALCKHGLKKGKCQECLALVLCKHDKQRSQCPECQRGLCVHGKRRGRCRECGGTEFCSHGKWRQHCRTCRPELKLRKPRRADVKSRKRAATSDAREADGRKRPKISEFSDGEEIIEDDEEIIEDDEEIIEDDAGIIGDDLEEVHENAGWKDDVGIENIDEEWKREGSIYIGERVRMHCPNLLPDGSGLELNGTVFGWLPAEESDFLDENGVPAALWRVKFDHPDMSAQDLEEHEVQEAAKCFTLYRERSEGLEG